VRLPPRYRPDLPPKSFVLYLHLFTAGLMTSASLLVVFVDPLTAAVGIVFFGAGLALAVAQRIQYLNERTTAMVKPFLGRLDRRNADGYVWLLWRLAKLDGRTPRARRRVRIALTAIGGDARLLDGLFVHCRQRRLSVDAFTRPNRSTLHAALASLHPDGRIRQAAVAAMGRRMRPEHMPFLMERAVDWVPEVRAAALGVLQERAEMWPQARSAYQRVARRKHAPAVAELLGLGMDPEPPELVRS
jgi:hypothetical protein